MWRVFQSLGGGVSRSGILVAHDLGRIVFTLRALGDLAGQTENCILDLESGRCDVSSFRLQFGPPGSGVLSSRPAKGQAQDPCHLHPYPTTPKGPPTTMIPGTGPKPAVPLMAAQPKKPGHMLVLGTGFVGSYVSERLLTQGWRVSGTCTSAAKKMELEKLGINASVFDATSSNLANLHALQDATHLLISIPPIPGVGDPLLASHADLQRTLTDSNLQWLCYLSSTGVYGDCGGAWVDEDHVVNPKSESSKLRYAAEEGWLDLVDDLDLSAFVLRLGGIYGPGRSALDTIAKSKSLSRRQKLRESKQYTARIHVADIYQAIVASMSIRSARKIYNVVDDDPAPRAEVFAFAQSLIEKSYPDLATDSAGPDSQGRIIAAEKRVSNARLKEELGVRLVHPSYRSGLQSIIDSWLAESTISRM